jgi:hypothetical protein
MHVIGHQDIGVDGAAVLVSGTPERVEIKGVVRYVKKAGMAVVATLQDMLWDAGKVNAWETCHRGRYLRSYYGWSFDFETTICHNYDTDPKV